jgi:2-polyprenyl-6-methoxyphenol hydroxylase-like FAD-dependent oxidoreductase
MKSSVVDTAVIGGGPAGLLCAILIDMQMQKKGVKNNLAVFELRPKPTNRYGSFPVVLNQRGMTALRKVGDDFFRTVQKAGLEVDAIEVSLHVVI